MWTPEYYVRLVELPPTVNGTVVPNPDGTFEIYLNSLLPPARQQECLDHEIRHILRDHFYSEQSVAACEAEADPRRAG